VGSPDFIIFAGFPRLFIVEAKRGKEKPSAAQAAMIAWFRKLGWDVDVVRSFRHFLILIAPSPTCPADRQANQNGRNAARNEPPVEPRN
jgi:hypothetical protein